MSAINKWLRGLRYSVKLLAGWLVYLISKKTPEYAYQSMVGLFCVTRGRSNDLLSFAISVLRRPYHFSDKAGLLGDYNERDRREQVLSQMREKGYYVFENRLPEAICDRLLEFSTTHSSVMRPVDGASSSGKIMSVYDRTAPEAVRYDFQTEDVLNHPDVQRILADRSFASVAQAYLNCAPVVDVLSMWWHTDYLDKPDKAAAQYFHFDMDRPKWIKFFIYLTDVGPDNGPHTFVPGSHKTDGIPQSMLKKGYARLSDEEVEAHYGRDAIVEFCAPKGTVIAEDTRGLHKGKHVLKGDRLILQVQFSNALFGGDYPKVKMEHPSDPGLADSIARYPSMYSAYL